MLMPHADRQRPKSNNSFHFLNFNPERDIALMHNINVRVENTTKCALNEGIFQTHACLYSISSVHPQVQRLDCILIFEHIIPCLIKQWSKTVRQGKQVVVSGSSLAQGLFVYVSQN